MSFHQIIFSHAQELSKFLSLIRKVSSKNATSFHPLSDYHSDFTHALSSSLEIQYPKEYVENIMSHRCLRFCIVKSFCQFKGSQTIYDNGIILLKWNDCWLRNSRVDMPDLIFNCQWSHSLSSLCFYVCWVRVWTERSHRCYRDKCLFFFVLCCQFYAIQSLMMDT